MDKAKEERSEEQDNRARLGPLYSYKVNSEENGKHIFTVSAALDNEEDREATEAAVRQEAQRRLQDGDWVQDEHYILSA